LAPRKIVHSRDGQVTALVVHSSLRVTLLASKFCPDGVDISKGFSMQTTLRPYTPAAGRRITTGVAVASLIAVAPGVTPALPQLPDELQASAVRLTAGWDPLTAWQTAFNTTSANASTLADNFFLAPGVGLQQAIVNQVGFLDQVLNDPSSLRAVLTQIADNAQIVASGLTGVDASADTAKAVDKHTVDALHGVVAGLLPTFLPPDIDAATVTAILNVLKSPMSGLLIGAVGPVVSPAVALLNSALAVGAALQSSDPSAALSDLLDVPANVVNAFFNGADLNLDAVASLVNQAGVLPEGTTINKLDFAFGGLFSVGSVSQGHYTQGDTLNPGIVVPGGSILNSVGLNITTQLGEKPVTLGIPSHAVGPLAALESVSQTVGVLLGDGWDGKKAVQAPPLSTLEFPTFRDTAEEPAAVEAAAIAPATDQAAGPANLPSTTARSVSLSIDSTAASTPKTETSAESSADGKSPEAPASKSENTDTTKSASAAESTNETAGSASTTTDSTTKADPTKAADRTKLSKKGTDVTTGNKVEPRKRAGSDTAKSGDAAGSTASQAATAENAGASSSTATSGGTEKATA
jgi:hypothetical protein